METIISRGNEAPVTEIGLAPIVHNTGMIHSRFTRPTITIAPEAEVQQQSLILGLAGVQIVSDQLGLNIATAVGVQSQRFCKDVEAARLATTKPLRDFTDQVNTLAKDLIAPVKSEMDRVGRHIAMFRQQEEERVRKEEAVRQRAIQEAEAAARAAAEAQRKAEAGMTTEADLQAALAAEAAAKAKELAYRTTVTAPLPEVQRSKGSAVRKEVRFEVVDIAAIYAARPELCRIELNASACRAILTATSIVPGLKITEETVGGFRVR